MRWKWNGREAGDLGQPFEVDLGVEDAPRGRRAPGRGAVRSPRACVGATVVIGEAHPIQSRADRGRPRLEIRNLDQARSARVRVMNERELLTDTTPFMPPARVLEGLSAAEAERRAGGRAALDRRDRGPHGLLAGVVRPAARRAPASRWRATRRRAGRRSRPAAGTRVRERFLVRLERLTAPATGPARVRSIRPSSTRRSRTTRSRTCSCTSRCTTRITSARSCCCGSRWACGRRPSGSYTW